MRRSELTLKPGYRWERGMACQSLKTGQTSLLLFDSGEMVINEGTGLVCRTPAEVQSYYSARPHVPCPFVFEVTP